MAFVKGNTRENMARVMQKIAGYLEEVQTQKNVECSKYENCILEIVRNLQEERNELRTMVDELQNRIGNYCNCRNI